MVTSQHACGSNCFLLSEVFFNHLSIASINSVLLSPNCVILQFWRGANICAHSSRERCVCGEEARAGSVALCMSADHLQNVLLHFCWNGAKYVGCGDQASGFHECGFPSPDLSWWTVLVWFRWCSCCSPAWDLSQRLLNSTERLPRTLRCFIHECCLHPNWFFHLKLWPLIFFPAGLQYLWACSP